MENIFNSVNFNACISDFTDEIIYIKDQENGCCEISNKDDFDIVVKNINNVKFSFLKIDKCVYNDNDGTGRKCDLSINNSLSIFFIEIKSINTENFSKKPKTNSKKDDALDQLIQTINKFKLKFPDLDLKNVHAVIALKPKINIYSQPIQTTQQIRINELLLKSGTPNLYVGNTISFK